MVNKIKQRKRLKKSLKNREKENKAIVNKRVDKALRDYFVKKGVLHDKIRRD